MDEVPARFELVPERKTTHLKSRRKPGRIRQHGNALPAAKGRIAGLTRPRFWPDSVAAGLRVPKPYGDYLILDILQKSGGTAVAATDAEIMSSLRHWAEVEGIFAAPEGAASLTAYTKLLATGFFKPHETVVLFNTGSGLKYLEVIEAYKKRSASPGRQIGGIIGPY